MMNNGYAAIIIQNSAGNGKAIEYNKSILTHSTLLASIKMPIDLFIGKSSVQTNIYVFRVGEAHQKMILLSLLISRMMDTLVLIEKKQAVIYLTQIEQTNAIRKSLIWCVLASQN